MFGSSKKEIEEIKKLESRLSELECMILMRLEDLENDVDKLEREVWGGVSQYRDPSGIVRSIPLTLSSKYIGQTKSLSRKIEDVKAVLNEVVDYTYKEK